MKKIKMLPVPILAALLLLPLISTAQKMNNNSMDKIIRKAASSVDGDAGAWQFLYQDRMMVCITDEGHNRMRIISPIIEEKELTEKQMRNCLVANFHTALDVKYAISDDILWAVFIHPLKELSESQMTDAIHQVYFATVTFGSSYSSTDLYFPGAREDEEMDEEMDEEFLEEDEENEDDSEM